VILPGQTWPLIKWKFDQVLLASFTSHLVHCLFAVFPEMVDKERLRLSIFRLYGRYLFVGKPEQIFLLSWHIFLDKRWALVSIVNAEDV